MSRNIWLAATFVLGAGLTSAGVAQAQSPTASAASPTVLTQPPPPPAEAPPPWLQPQAPTIKPADPNRNQPTYSVDPPPPGSSGVYLPAAVLGYAKSATGCVVVGCDDGPHANGAAEPASPAPAAPPAANPGSSTPH